MADLIQSLWVGPRLSVMEQLCIRSFLQNGHPFHLYVYGPLEGVPPGAVVLDANTILPSSRIFTYREHDTYAGFANFFRYKLLLEKGGWFVDADTICVKPFDFQPDYVFSSEAVNGRQFVNLAAVKTPRDSPAMRYAWESCERMDTGELKWSQCGPTLAMKAVEACALQSYVQPADVFCPVHFSLWEKLLDPSAPLSIPDSAYGIHLWNELWRRSGRNKDADYPADCLYEQLKKRYLQ